jgi:K+-transporting ATPase ATPase A chain
MTPAGWAQIALSMLAVFAVTRPLGAYMARVFNRERTFFDPIARPLERLLYRVTGVREDHEMRWTEYAGAMLLFSAVSMLLLYLIERVQRVLPLDPQKLGAVPGALAFNTAASFTTNTNWQAYVPETTMSYLTQMLGLAYHNFVSAAVGIALAIALIRGVARRERDTIGNFWVDITRASLWLLLPLSFAFALFLVSQGVVQNFKPYVHARLLDAKDAGSGQVIAQGPAASQEAIKMLGTNGGGFFNANSSHPFENPTPLTNFLEVLAIFAIPAGLTYTLGLMTGSQRHGWAVWGAMAVLFLAGVAGVYAAEAHGNPLLRGVDQRAGNMEGKEVRFGVAGSALFATATTDASCGAVNAMHDSFTPLGGLVLLVNMMLGEVVFGGVGAGLYGMLVFVILTVFIAGLMVGRTPEYLGKKIEAYDVKMAMLAVLIFPLAVLVFTAISVVKPFGVAGILNPGPHGFSEVLYAFTSAAANNGSAFAGLNAATRWYEVAIAVAAMVGRFFVIVPVLAIAGSLARKKAVPPSPGTFPVHTPLFSVLLMAVIVIVGALTFFPALSLGPVLEHLLMAAGRSF